jgi:hypothetical protein
MQVIELLSRCIRGKLTIGSIELKHVDNWLQNLQVCQVLDEVQCDAEGSTQARFHGKPSVCDQESSEVEITEQLASQLWHIGN